MKESAKSVFYFGIYLLFVGFTLLLLPNMLLGLFGISPAEDVWVRVVGMLAFILGVYYITAARNGLKAFIQMSVYLRSLVIIFFGAFVGLGMVEPPLLFFGAVDLLGAAWTQLALRKEGRLAPQI